MSVKATRETPYCCLVWGRGMNRTKPNQTEPPRSRPRGERPARQRWPQHTTRTDGYGQRTHQRKLSPNKHRHLDRFFLCVPWYHSESYARRAEFQQMIILATVTDLGQQQGKKLM